MCSRSASKRDGGRLYFAAYCWASVVSGSTIATSCAAGFLGSADRKPFTCPWTRPTIATRIGLLESGFAARTGAVAIVKRRSNGAMSGRISVLVLEGSTNLHGFGVPVDDASLLHAQITEQRGRCGAETECRVFDRLLAAADGGEEVREVSEAVGIATRRGVLFDRVVRFPGRLHGRILLAVQLDRALLHLVRKRADAVAWFLLAWGTCHGDGLAGDLHRALGPGKEEAFALVASIDEVDAQREVEALGVVEQRKQNIGDVAAILPEAQTSGGHRAGRAFGAGDEVGSAEEMDEEIAGDSAAIV